MVPASPNCRRTVSRSSLMRRLRVSGRVGWAGDIAVPQRRDAETDGRGGDRPPPRAAAGGGPRPEPRRAAAGDPGGDHRRADPLRVPADPAVHRPLRRHGAFGTTVYTVTLLSTATATLVLIAPVSFDRTLFRRHRKPELVAFADGPCSSGWACSSSASPARCSSCST